MFSQVLCKKCRGSFKHIHLRISRLITEHAAVLRKQRQSLRSDVTMCKRIAKRDLGRMFFVGGIQEKFPLNIHDPLPDSAYEKYLPIPSLIFMIPSGFRLRKRTFACGITAAPRSSPTDGHAVDVQTTRLCRRKAVNQTACGD